MSFNSQTFTFDQLENRRLLAAGAVDQSLSFAREMALPPQIDYVGMRGSDFLRLSDGSVVVAGHTYRERDFGFLGLTKFRPDGSLDLSFGNNGVALSLADLNEYDPVRAVVAADSAGRLLVADLIRTPSGADLVVQRFTATGDVDQSVGDYGAITIPLNADDGNAADIVVDSSGRILVCGSYTRYESGAVQLSFLARFTPTLTPDDTFGVNGVAEINASLHGETLEAIKVSGDGKIVGVGAVDEPSGRHILVARFNGTGDLDQTFDGNGLAAIDGIISNSLTIDSAGQVVVAGWDSFATGSPALPSATTITIQRLRSNGSVDPSFGGTLIEMGINGGLSQLPASFDQLPNHRMALQLRANGGFELAAFQTEYRFTSIGRPDRSFDGDGKRALEPNTVNFYFPYGRTSFTFEPSGTLVTLRAPYYGEYPNSGFPSFEVRRFVNGRKSSEYNATLEHASITVAGASVLSDGRLILNSRVAEGYDLQAFTRNGTVDNSWGDRSHNILYSGPNIFSQPNLIPNTDGGLYYSQGRNDQSDGDGIAGGISFINASGKVVFSRVNAQSLDETADRFHLLPGGFLFHQNYSYGGGRDNSVVVQPDGTRVKRDVPELFQPEDEFYATAYTSRAVNVGRTGKTFVSGWQRLPDGSERSVLYRYRADGSLDSSFDGDGIKVVQDVGLRFSQSNGAALYSRPSETGLRRLQPNGATDNNFGKNGIAAVGFDNFTLDSQNRIIAWRTLVGGAADGDVQVMRLTANGKIDTTFGGGDGLVVIDTKLPSTAKQNLLVTPQNKIVVTAVQLSEMRVKWSATRLLAE